MTPRKCQTCGKKYQPRQSSKYCSTTCRGRARHRPPPSGKPRGPVPWTGERRAEAKRLRAEGKTQAEIGKILGVSRERARQYLVGL